MTKNEAILQMKNGHRVKHYLFSDDEFIYMKDGSIHDESGYLMECKDAHGNDIDFWTDRTDEQWLDGWIVLPDLQNEENNILGSGIELLFPFHRVPNYESPIIPRTSKYDCISKNSHKRSNFRKKR